MNSDQFERLLQSDWQLDFQSVFIKAWDLYKSQALLFVTFTLFILSTAFLFVMYLQPYMILFSALLLPPLYAGFYLVANKISRGESVIYPDFFAGFNYWLITIGISLVSQVLTAVGLFLFVIPGIYLLVAYILAVPMGIFGGLDLWSAMEKSRKLVTRFFWKFFVLVIVLIVYNGLGFLLLGAGILITLPMTFLVIYVVFEDLTSEIFAEDNPSHVPKS